jgi:hypothetical protein
MMVSLLAAPMSFQNPSSLLLVRVMSLSVGMFNAALNSISAMRAMMVDPAALFMAS